MNWNEGAGRWFKLGRESFPQVDTWKELSSVKGAPRTGAIFDVDGALAAAAKLEFGADFLTQNVGASNLFLACDAMLRGIGAFDLQAKQRREAVEELKRRAGKAREYYSNAAPVFQAILSHPTDIFQLKESRASAQVLVDRVFRNFVSYARASWHYASKSKWSGDDLLAGRTNTIPCGGIANALRIVLGTVAPEPGTVRFVTLSGDLVTRRKYSCFDRLVRGNVRSKTDEFDGSCFFTNHFFLTWGGLYYDPCMTAIYVCETDVIQERPVKLSGVSKLDVLARQGAGRADSLYLNDPATATHGFGSTWARIPIAEVKDVSSLVEAVPRSLKDTVKGAPADAKVIAEYCARAR